MNPSVFAVLSPKIHLHCHLEGSLRATTFLELTARYGYSTRYRPGVELEGPRSVDDVFRFSDFREFLLLFGAVSRSLARVEDYARLAHEFVDDAKAQNVVYGELFVSPSVWAFFHPDLDLDAAIEAIAAELQGEPRFHLIVDVTRNFGVESAARTVERAIRWRDRGVVGVGLGGDEANFPAEWFAAPFSRARDAGLHVVAHAGEAAGAASVRAALDVGAERIGHGIRALEDPGVVALLRDGGIPVEVCPTSNFRTAVVHAHAPHPIAQLDRAGLRIVVDADDPTLFGTSITGEYAYVEATLGRAAMERFILNAVGASFLNGRAKRSLYERVYADIRRIQ